MSAEISTLRENCFSNSTDPRLAYFDMPRRNTIARLLTGLYQGDGLFVLIGEEGIGKTTLLRHLGAQVAALSGVRLLHTTAVIGCYERATFASIVEGCVAPFVSAGVDPLEFARLLQDLAAEGEQMAAILIDDADRLDDAGLRAIATLTTLRSGERRLLSAVLAGTGELARRLATISGLADRLPADRVIQLSGMSRGDVEKMIRHRLRQAGRPDVEQAMQPPIVELAGQCNGVPLQVLGLCRRALHAAETTPPRLSSPVSVPAAGSAGVAYATAGIQSSVPTEPMARPSPSAITSSDASATGGTAGPDAGSDVPAASARLAATDGFNGPVSAQTGEAPVDVKAANGSFAEYQGHIRYTAASARRVEPARWQTGAPRRRRGRRASLAVGTVLIVLAAGWAVYDHTPRKIVNSGSAHTRVVDPMTASALSPSLLPPPVTSSQPVVPPSASAPTFQSTPPPAISGTASVADSGWPSPSFVERSDGDVRPAPSDTSGSTTGNSIGSVPFALPAPSAATDAGDKGAVPSSPPPDRQTARREVPEPIAESSTPAATPRPAPRSASPAATPRSVAVTSVSAKPVAAEVMPSRSADAKPQARGRQKDALLMEGDEQLLAGEVDAARATYQEAFDRGSVEAARRLAQTFDPRNVSATSTEASAAEAILWYKDAAKRGDRRARGELQGLESWLEDAAATGNSDARRVLKTWRAPPPADDPAGGTQAEP